MESRHTYTYTKAHTWSHFRNPGVGVFWVAPFDWIQGWGVASQLLEGARLHVETEAFWRRTRCRCAFPSWVKVRNTKQNKNEHNSDIHHVNGCSSPNPQALWHDHTRDDWKHPIDVRGEGLGKPCPELREALQLVVDMQGKKIVNHALCLQLVWIQSSTTRAEEIHAPTQRHRVYVGEKAKGA